MSGRREVVGQRWVTEVNDRFKSVACESLSDVLVVGVYGLDLAAHRTGSGR
jgi:hypothetical protein